MSIRAMFNSRGRFRPALVAPLAALLAVGATATTVVSAPAAHAALPPELAALLRSSPPLTLSGEDYTWTLSIAAEGPLAEHPGNLHEANITIGVLDSTYLRAELTYVDSECTDGVCRAVAVAYGARNAITPPPTVAPDGSAHVVIDFPRGTVSGVFGYPAPVTEGQVDLRLTPQDWQDPRGATPETAQYVQRSWTPTGHGVFVENRSPGGRLSATGSILGVPAQRVKSGTWSATYSAGGEAGPGTPPVTTPAEARRWLPPTSQGRLVNATRISPGDQYLVRGPIVTSTGYRLPGNTYLIYAGGVDTRTGGAPVHGQDPDGQYISGAHIAATRQCAAGQAWEQCTPVEDGPRIHYETTGRYDLRQPLRLRVRATQPVVTLAPDGTPAETFGTVDHTIDLTAAGTGKAEIIVRLNRTQGTWEQETRLSYDETRGSVTLAGRAATRPAGDTDYIAFTHSSKGTL